MNKIFMVIICFITMTFSDTTVIVDIPNTSNKQLHDRCVVWVAKVFNNKNTVLQLDTPDKIIIKCGFTSNATSGWTGWGDGFVDYTVCISIKDNKYKVTLDQFYHRTTNMTIKYNGNFGNIWDVTTPRPAGWGNDLIKTNINRSQIVNIQGRAFKEIDLLLKSLNNFLSSSEDETNDDW